MNKLYRDTVTLYHADAAAQTVVVFRAMAKNRS